MVYRPDIAEILISLAYLLLAIAAAFVYLRIARKGEYLYKYYLLSFVATLSGGVLFALISIFYYKGGDTFVYFLAGNEVASFNLSENHQFIKFFFTSGKDIRFEFSDFQSNFFYIIKGRDVFTMIKLTSLFNILGLFCYIPSTILFSIVSFYCKWKGYLAMNILFPGRLARLTIIPFFFFPSVLLWSNGILKDTLTTAAICLIIYALARIIQHKKLRLKESVFLVVGFLILLFLKVYILYIFIPASLFWLLNKYRGSINNLVYRIIIFPLAVAVFITVTFFAITIISSQAEKYSIENIERTLEGFNSWHNHLAETRDQSGYTLGIIELTPLGMLKIAPEAIVVTFFRPFIWEIRNLPTLLGALEALFILLLLLRLLIKYHKGVFQTVFKSKELIFFITFSLLFGLVTGISSYNFGALSRYKIPAVIFFLSVLFIIQKKLQQESKTKN